MLSREHILIQALTLPPADQAFLAQALEHHLALQIAHEIAEYEGISGEAPVAELRQRSEAYRAGKMSARKADDILAELRQRQSDES